MLFLDPFDRFDKPLYIYIGHTIAQAVRCWLPGSGHVGFVQDKVALGYVFCE
jgi:hypothetical protein